MINFGVRSPLSALLYLETCHVSGYCTLQVHSGNTELCGLRQSAQWLEQGQQACWQSFGGALHLPLLLSNIILFLLVRGNSRMRNGVQLVGVNREKAGIGLQPVFQLEWTYSNLFQLPDHFRTDLKLKQVVEGIAQIAS